MSSAGPFVLSAAVLLAGCGPVAPHERGHLARRNMQVGGMGELTFGEEHAQAYREGATGGGSVRAGGCGCN
jgi:hypothetical protein